MPDDLEEVHIQIIHKDGFVNGENYLGRTHTVAKIHSVLNLQLETAN